MTRADLNRIHRDADKKGSRWVTGYCKFYDDDVDKYSMIELGTNRGMYGWNWTLYYCKENDTFYVDGYRNF